MNGKINVFSAFGGADQGADTVRRMGMEDRIGTWFYSEFDPYPSKLAYANFPDHIHVGDVTKVRDVDGAVEFGGCERSEPVKIDFLIGGAPCQDLSIAGKRAGLAGSRSSLFWEFVRLRDEMKPEYVFMENVASMPKEAFEAINDAMGFDGVKRNAAVVSAQSRKRYYWFGKRRPDGTYERFDTPEPKDRGIVLRDILEDIPLDDPRWKPVPEKYAEAVREKIGKFETKKREGCLSVHTTNPSGRGMNGNVFYDGAKAPAITTNKGEGNKVLFTLPRGTQNGCVNEEKTHALSRSEWERNNMLVCGIGETEKGHSVSASGPATHPADYFDRNARDIVLSEKSKPVLSGCQEVSLSDALERSKGDVVISENLPQYVWRKLTVRECALLQGFSETYDFSSVSASRACKAIGNSWQGDQIEDFFRYLPYFVNHDHENA